MAHGLGRWKMVLKRIVVTSLAISTLVGWRYVDTDTLLGLPATSGIQSDASSAQVALGQKLFFDRRLSKDGATSCASCHMPEHAFSDGRPLPIGLNGQLGVRNTPSLINVAYAKSFFWDGRRDSLESQAFDPLLHPREHGLQDQAAVLRTLAANPDYVAAFRHAYRKNSAAINADDIANALAAYERTLVAGDSPFDRFYFGKQESALTESEKRGYAIFVGRAQCTKCHTIDKGFALFSDGQFHSVGVGSGRFTTKIAELAVRYAANRKSESNSHPEELNAEELSELGRFAQTLSLTDLAAFKTPSLRNVAITAPYMHDGSIATLEEAVDLELYYRGLEERRTIVVTPAERADLVSFLRSLTGNNSKLIPRKQ